MKTLSVVLVLFVAIFVVGCDLIDDLIGGDQDDTGRVSFAIDLSHPKALGYSITKVHVILTHQVATSTVAEADLTIDGANETATGTINDLRTGTWSVTIELFESTTSVGNGTGTVTITKDAVAEANIYVDLDTGSAKVTVYWGATLVFEDDFESYTAGSYPTADWTTTWSGVDAEISTDYAKSGTNSFKLSSSPSWARSESYSMTPSDRVMFEASVYLPSTNGQSAQAGFYNPSGGTWGSYFASVYFREGVLLAHGGVEIAPSYSTDAWHVLKVRADFSIQKMNVYIDGTLIASDIDAGDGAYDRFFIMAGNFATGSNVVYFDDIKISTF